MSQSKIAYCGLVCSDCPAFRATQANDIALAQATAREWSEQFHIDVKLEDVWCDGCSVEGRKCAHCGECRIRACAREHRVSTCAACADYGTCASLQSFLAMVPGAKATLDRLRG